jgi:hypothetical protein
VRSGIQRKLSSSNLKVVPERLVLAHKLLMLPIVPVKDPLGSGLGMESAIQQNKG